MAGVNCISFSLYGSDPKYLSGSVANAKDVVKFYPSWKMHIWVSDEIPEEVKTSLKKAGAIVHSPVHSVLNKMFWRFLIHDLPGVERYIIRDVDSRFSEREVKAVHEWIASGRQLHVMRDHPVWHKAIIMGGLFGWKKLPGDFEMAKLIQPWAQTVKFGQDQDFLAAEVWPRAKSRTVHDVRTNWPVEGEDFCGEYIDASGRPNQDHRRLRLTS